MKKFIQYLKFNLHKLIPDVLYLKLYFKMNYKRKIDLKNPLTFNEKLWWIHIFNRDPLTTKCSDKVLVRDYVNECGLSSILNEVYKVYEKPEDICLDELPKEFYLKLNHLSDGNFYVKDKTDLRFDIIKKQLKDLMKRNYYWNSREWNYKNITPRIICEKVLKDNISPHGLIDYRFFCFNGEVKFLCVDINTASEDGSHSTDARRNVYDTNFNNLGIKYRRPNFDDNNLSKPINFDLMLKYASILASPFEFCRIDLYNINGVVIFGEITFHQGGSHDITPERYQSIWGDLIDINSTKLITAKKAKRYLYRK